MVEGTRAIFLGGKKKRQKSGKWCLATIQLSEELVDLIYVTLKD